ncbi:MAG TPA: hypothetical protein VN873_18100 [Candidatus Angelobacter sp.]|nr:hypothetical protein [Candidatus Angelobacter sp.]
MQAKLLRAFWISSAIILTFTGITKVISAIVPVPILNETDPVLGLTTRWVLVLVGLLELAVVAVIIIFKQKPFAHLLVAVIGTEFLLYRVVFETAHFSRGCPCLGRFTAWVHIPDPEINKILVAVASWLCIGGFTCFFLSSSRKKEYITAGK